MKESSDVQSKKVYKKNSKELEKCVFKKVAKSQARKYERNVAMN